MKSWGVWLLILGIGSFILPVFGLQFALLNIFGESQVLAAIGMIIVGVVLLVVSSRQQTTLLSHGSNSETASERKAVE
jgi:hypothetical protein